MADVKALDRVLLIFIPVPIFWTLYDQQGSSWTLQAEELKSFSMACRACHTRVAQRCRARWACLSPTRCRASTPSWCCCSSPCLRSSSIRRSSTSSCRSRPCSAWVLVRSLLIIARADHRAGMIFCALAFVVSAILQQKIDSAYMVPSSPGAAQALVRSLHCSLPPPVIAFTGPHRQSGRSRLRGAVQYLRLGLAALCAAQP